MKEFFITTLTELFVIMLFIFCLGALLSPVFAAAKTEYITACVQAGYTPEACEYNYVRDQYYNYSYTR